MTHNPLSQFLIKPIIPLSLFGYDISFTNSSLMMVVASLTLIIPLLLSSVSKASIIPSRFEAGIEYSYEFILDLLDKNVGPQGQKFAPIIFTFFFFILTCNLLGMLPYGFTVTSHIVVTFALAIVVFLIVTITGFVLHGTRFFSLFLPAGIPWWLAPLMIVIELFTYLARPISLSLRLAANMTAGHILLKVIAGFIVSIGAIFKFLPIYLVVMLCGFEVFIALLQAYIFTILACVYISDAVNLH